MKNFFLATAAICFYIAAFYWFVNFTFYGGSFVWSVVDLIAAVTCHILATKAGKS